MDRKDYYFKGNSKMPKHIAIMMDGNGRWAIKNNKARKYGHVEGGNVLKEIIKVTDALGIKYLTVFAFSTENWNRPKEEVDNLLNLLLWHLGNEKKQAIQNNMRIRVLGDESKLSTELQAKIRDVEEETKSCNGLNFQIAINYGGRDDLLRAFKNMYSDLINRRIDIDTVDEKTISKYLDTFDIPDPDLFIRTGGEQRISNFLLWQFAYTEFAYTDTLWPDLKKEEFINIVHSFCDRERRFGTIIE